MICFQRQYLDDIRGGQKEPENNVASKEVRGLPDILSEYNNKFFCFTVKTPLCVKPFQFGTPDSNVNPRTEI